MAAGSPGHDKPDLLPAASGRDRLLATSPYAPIARGRVDDIPYEAPPWSTSIQAICFEFYRRSEAMSGGSALAHWAADIGLKLRPLWDRRIGAAVLPFRFLGEGRADFAEEHDPDARMACAIEVLERDDATVADIVAFDLERPDRFGTMLGRSVLLDEWTANTLATYHLDGRLSLFRTPLDWIRAGCAGAVLLDRGRADVLGDLPGPILAADKAHALALFRAARGCVDPDMIRWRDG